MGRSLQWKCLLFLCGSGCSCPLQLPCQTGKGSDAHRYVFLAELGQKKKKKKSCRRGSRGVRCLRLLLWHISSGCTSMVCFCCSLCDRAGCYRKSLRLWKAHLHGPASVGGDLGDLQEGKQGDGGTTAPVLCPAVPL